MFCTSASEKTMVCDFFATSLRNLWSSTHDISWVPYYKTHYFIDRGARRGDIVYRLAVEELQQRTQDGR